MKSLSALLLIICLAAAPAAAQNYLESHESYFQTVAGTEVYLAELPGEELMYLSMTVQCGPYKEDTSTYGFSRMLKYFLLTADQDNPDKLMKNERLADAGVDYWIADGPEFLRYYFQFKPSQYEMVLQELYTLLSAPSFDSTKLERIRAQANADISQQYNEPAFTALDQQREYLWRDQAQQYHPSHLIDTLDSAGMDRLKAFFAVNFCPENVMFAIAGDLDARTAFNTLQYQLREWPECVYNVFSKNRLHPYDPIKFSAQFVYEDEDVKRPFFQFAFQGPTTYSIRRHALAAYLLGSITQNPNSDLNRFIRDSTAFAFMGIESKLLQYTNQLNFFVAPKDSSMLDSTYQNFLALWQGDSLRLPITERDVTTAADSFAATFLKAKQGNGPQRIALVSDFYQYYDIDIYSTFTDTLAAIKPADIKKMLNEYFYKKHLIGLMALPPEKRSAWQTDTFFTTTALHIDDYTLRFKANTAQFTDAGQDSILRSLAHFLKINPHKRIKVNGNALESELLQVKDKAMRKWVRSLDHFIINPPSLINKVKIRLDVYRSITVIKKLTELGVPTEQLFGAGKRIRKEKGEEYYRVYTTLFSN